MYNRTYWQDHVTEFDNRFREQNNADGTISHIPVEGEIIQQGTPQNAANFNRIETGIFAATEITAELARITLHGGSGTGNGGVSDIPEPSDSNIAVMYREIALSEVEWKETADGVFVDVPIDGVTGDMIPIVAIANADKLTATICGLNSVAETVDGFIRFFAESAPVQPITAYATLISPSAKIGGTVSGAYVASREQGAEMIKNIFGES